MAVGGEDDKVVLRSVEGFDPQNFSWKTLACLPFAVSKHGLVVTGGLLAYLPTWWTYSKYCGCFVHSILRPIYLLHLHYPSYSMRIV